MPRIVYKNLLALIAIFLPSLFAIHAQESAYEIMRGYSGQTPPAPSPVFANSESPQLQFQPRLPTPRRKSENTAGAAYCVRTCDGRYFPAPTLDNASRAEGCNSLCPASEIKVFYGNSIDGASSKEGKLYSSLPNAFRYRKELVTGCTCNGKDVVGLASIELNHDRTLRRGDIVAGNDGLEVVRNVSEGEPDLAALSKRDRGQFGKVPVVASQ
jgi:hypothetical protein